MKELTFEEHQALLDHQFNLVKQINAENERVALLQEKQFNRTLDRFIKIRKQNQELTSNDNDTAA